MYIVQGGRGPPAWIACLHDACASNSTSLEVPCHAKFIPGGREAAGALARSPSPDPPPERELLAQALLAGQLSSLLCRPMFVPHAGTPTVALLNTPASRLRGDHMPRTRHSTERLNLQNTLPVKRAGRHPVPMRQRFVLVENSSR